MKDKVFILQYYLNQIPNKDSGEFPIQGNLNELNALLDKDWVIKSYVVLASQGNVQNILYHLCETGQGVHIPL